MADLLISGFTFYCVKLGWFSLRLSMTSFGVYV